MGDKIIPFKGTKDIVESLRKELEQDFVVIDIIANKLDRMGWSQLDALREAVKDQLDIIEKSGYYRNESR